jgi:plasmid replication initiation protein
MNNEHDDLVVVKDNNIINSSYRLTLVEQRIILGCISKIDSTRDFTDEDGFTIHVSEIEDLVTEGQLTSLYTQIKLGTNRLYERSIRLNDDDTDLVRWIYRRVYNDSEGSVTLYFTKNVLPYLTQLKGNFTKYKLQYVSKFNSTHSIRIYELLVQWLSKGTREVEIDWLKKTLGVEDKYKRTNNFIERVVKKSIDDINTHSNITVKYGTRKTGRRVTHIQFEFDVKQQHKGIKKGKKGNFKGIDDEQIQQFCSENVKLTQGKTLEEVKMLMLKRT